MATQDRLPTGVGGANSWTSSVPGNKWEDVDDPIGTPDDDATYIYRQDTNQSQGFTFTPFDINSSAIAKFTVTRRTRKTAPGGLSTGARMRVNGSPYVGSTNGEGTSYATRSYDWLTNPDTAAAWTEADIEGTGSNPLQEFGVRCTNMSGGEEAICTQVYATVDYTTAVGLSIPIAMHHYKQMRGN